MRLPDVLYSQNATPDCNMYRVGRHCVKFDIFRLPSQPDVIDIVFRMATFKHLMISTKRYLPSELFLRRGLATPAAAKHMATFIAQSEFGLIRHGSLRIARASITQFSLARVEHVLDKILSCICLGYELSRVPSKFSSLTSV